MRKYQVLCTCGHIVETAAGSVYSNSRPDTYKFRAKVLCPDCFHSRGTASSKTESTSQPLLLELTGSPYQVAWAEGIRSELIAQLGESTSHYSLDVQQALWVTFFGFINEHTDAKWWINHQRHPLAVLVEAGTDTLHGLIIRMIDESNSNTRRRDRQRRVSVV